MKPPAFLMFLFFMLIKSAVSQQLAFPGAVGFGRFASGGRGGTVYRVTNLNDRGPGSFRDAVSEPGRIVIFDVSGVIHIKDRLIFSKNITVAGQTAPGGGIVVYGNGVSFSGADNLIVRYVTFRMGRSGDSGKDAAAISNGKNMIFDHVSISWGRDETFSISWDNKGNEPANITIQNSIIAQGLVPHSAGGLVQTNGGVTLFRNLYIDNKTRNPKVKGLNQFVNNVVYNWGSGGCYILGDSEATSWATIVNNYFINGPSASTTPFSRANSNFQLFAEGNYHDGNKNGVLDGYLLQKEDYGPVTWINSKDEWTAVEELDSDRIPQMHPDIPILTTAQEAYLWIIDSVGSCLPERDQVDKLLIEQVKSLGEKGALISSEDELFTQGPGIIYNAPPLVDTDNDGIPDVWEKKLGFNPSVDDAMEVAVDGYTYIEKYINSITEPIEYLKYPININATNISTSSVTLEWENYETNATELIVEISQDGDDFEEVKRMPGDATSCIVEELKSGTKYFFRFKSINSTMESSYSKVVVVFTEEEPMAPVESINPFPPNQQQDVDYRKLRLSWENSTNLMAGPISYRIYLGTSSDQLSLINETTETSIVLEVLESGTTYYWRVEAQNSLGMSNSDVWTFTTAKEGVKNVLLYIPFDENFGTIAKDEVSGLKATAVKFTPIWVEGKRNNAVFFPEEQTGSCFLLEHNDNIFLDHKPFTISLWFKSKGGKDNPYLLHKGMHDYSNGGNGKWFGIQYKETDLIFAIDDDTNKTEIRISGADKWFNNEWHHLACVRDVENSLIKMFVDGELIGQQNDKTGGIGSKSALVIGNRNGYFDNMYYGYLDELSIYDSALSRSEIIDVMIDSPPTKDNFAVEFHNVPVVASPNPFFDSLMLNLGENFSDKELKVRIFNDSGKLVFSAIQKPLNGIIYIKNTAFLKEGLYLCKVSGNEHEIIVKILKARR